MKPKKQRKKRCDQCKRLFPISELQHIADPYESEINNDDTLYWLCEACIKVSEMEI